MHRKKVPTLKKKSVDLPAMTEVDLSLFPRMGLTLPSLLGGTRKFPSQLAAPTLELKCKQKNKGQIFL